MYNDSNYVVASLPTIAHLGFRARSGGLGRCLSRCGISLTPRLACMLLLRSQQIETSFTR